MAQCSYCSKKGFFVVVDKKKACNKCSPLVTQTVNRHIEIIKESEELVKKSKKFETRIGRSDDILNQINHLRGYAEKGYPFKTDWDNYERKITNIKTQLIGEFAHLKVTEYLQKAEIAKTIGSKLTNANKALLHLADLQNLYNYENQKLDKLTKDFIHKAEYNDLLEKAEKEEFKSNTKKAIDKYQDVLFFLRRDDIDDRLQAAEIEKIESKINSLSGQLSK